MTGENCTDEVRRKAYLKALEAKKDVEEAKAKYDKAHGVFRNILKKYDGMGVSKEAILYALSVRHEDLDEIVLSERDKLAMLELSGIVSLVKERILQRLAISEATTEEGSVLSHAQASDLGSAAGRHGESRDVNPFRPGTAEHVQWVAGWMSGQRAIADEMLGNISQSEDAEPVQPPKRGRPSKNKTPTASIAGHFEPDNAQTVAGQWDEDESL